MIVITSHDRELLGLADQIAGLSGGQVRIYGGNLAAYSERLAAEQAAAERAVTELPDTAVPAGRTILNLTGLADAPWHPAFAEHAPDPAPGPRAAAAARRAPAPDPAAAARFAPAAGPAPAAGALAELIIRGPERIALTGPNGSGKTTLLRAIAGLAPRPGLDARLRAVAGYLPQRLDILDDSLSVLGNVRAAAPAASVNEARAGLARFLFRGERGSPAGRRLSCWPAALVLAGGSEVG